MPNRIIKESINCSESLAACSVGANLLFDRLTTQADDHGCFDARVKIIRGKVFPLMMSKVKEIDIEKWLNELLSVDCIRMWIHSNGARYGLFPNFSDHQTIRSLHKRKTPEPPESLTLLNTETTAVDNNCKQERAVAPFNPNPNPNPNPEKDFKTSEKNKSSPTKKVYSETYQAEQFWNKEFERIIGRKPLGSPAKDRSILKILIKTFGLDEVKSRMVLHLEGKKFLSIGGLKTCFNDIGVIPKKPFETADERNERESRELREKYA